MMTIITDDQDGYNHVGDGEGDVLQNTNQAMLTNKMTQIAMMNGTVVVCFFVLLLIQLLFQHFFHTFVVVADKYRVSLCCFLPPDDVEKTVLLQLQFPPEVAEEERESEKEREMAVSWQVLLS